MSRILITGSTGFIGSNLIKLLKGRHDMILLSRRPPDSLTESNIKWFGIDLTKPFDFSGMPKKIDSIIHLAQSNYYRQFPEKAGDIFGVNVQGTFRLIEYARYARAESFIFASTGSVYGYGKKKLLETDPVNPSNFYGISKYFGELLLRAYEPFLRTVIFRFFSVYGPDQDKMLIYSLLEKVRKEETITIEGSPGLCINPIYIGDAVRVFDSALNSSVSGVFNVAGDEVVTILELVELIEKVVHKDASIKHTKSQRSDDLVGENTRMKEILNVLPETSLHEGLKKMV
jgi:nucleoside-diphosphate-sugar epimerase